jgi:hypothetical protein
MVSAWAVKRPVVRALLPMFLCLTAAFAAWSWYRPYAWNPDPAAGCRVKLAQVRKDHGFYWLDLHLKVVPGQTHDFARPVRLLTAAGRELEPADTTLGGMPAEGTTDIWLKFWLEPADLDGPLKLRINRGTLQIRSESGLPALGVSNSETFNTHHW